MQQTPNPTSPLEQLASAVRTRVTRRMSTLARFADADAARVPLGLRTPHTRAAWAAMSTDDRLAHLRATVIATTTDGEIARAEAQARAAAQRQLEAERRALERAEAEQAKPTTTPARRAVRYWVSCARGCGAHVPAPGPRPVLRYCTGQASGACK